jgi:tRNA dimethylallyltransferase
MSPRKKSGVFMKEKVIFLVGPTAVGKSEVAVQLAKKIGAEIISCDSMQVYKGMDIISSQPAVSLTKKVPHHLVGIVSPEREYNVSLYRKQAVKKMKEILKRGKIPLFVGGTGLYMTILLDGIFSVKTEDLSIREKLYKQAEQYGSLYIYEKLKTIDPDAAAKIHPNDIKRVVRALEVFEVTGKLISFLQKKRKGIADAYDVKIFCLFMERETLYQRIRKRVERMCTSGLAKEVAELLKLKLSKTAGVAIGIRELKGYFDGQYDLNQAKQLMSRNTCLYSKRQLTWFRKDTRINWIDVSGKEKADEVAGRIAVECGVKK